MQLWGKVSDIFTISSVLSDIRRNLRGGFWYFHFNNTNNNQGKKGENPQHKGVLCAGPRSNLIIWLMVGWFDFS